MAETTTRAWSPQQEAIFEWFADGEGNLVVVALAGTGKTTTSIEGISRAPERNILFCAYNKRIQEEIASRLTNDRAEAKTCHALGYGDLRLAYPEARVAKFIPDRAKSLTLAACEGTVLVPEPVEKLISKLHTLARETRPHAETGADLQTLQDAHDLCLDSLAQSAPGMADYTPEWIADKAARALILARDPKSWKDVGIDFADMIYLPVVLRLGRPEYDLIVVDEAQDMTVTQLELALMALQPGGRVCVVGDPNQAIYGFRGADSGSIARLKAELSAVELPLTTTYRCGHAIVKEAQTLVPDFEAAPGNGPGEIRHFTIEEMLLDVAPGREDFVLSRTNAPLAMVAMSLIRSGVRVRIAGKDIGQGLIALVKRLDRRGTIPALLSALDTWEAKEVARLEASKRPAGIPGVQDRADTIRMLAEGVVGPKELLQRIESLFSDSGRNQVVCSTVHKSKGLEAARVFVLRDTLYPKWGTEDEENNIAYVAITRAIETLTFVGR